MSVVSLLGVNVLNNPAKFGDPYKFEITFECLEALQKDLEWKLTYVGSATSYSGYKTNDSFSDEHDQELDSLLVGPIPVGVNKFLFEADAPDTKRIPDAEILGVTVILLTCAYDGREFVRVGYYVNNEYDSEELNADPPAKPLLDRVRRNVLAEKPRVTRFAIKWDSDASAPAEYPPDQPEADLVADGEEYGAEEAEEEDEEELEGEEAAAVDPDAMQQDSEMAGAEGEGAAAEESDDGSEDLEAESSGSEDEEAEEEEADGDDAMEMDGVDNDKAADKSGVAHQVDEVMAH
ncbi:putative ASF1-anti-silencing protein [Rutstroemia sp. NJR-2017a WRK4]|nr:putative ASF1-anti-silencing protein [Rutstroemia sp. NJR-2017a WRK4]